MIESMCVRAALARAGVIYERREFFVSRNTLFITRHQIISIFADRFHHSYRSAVERKLQFSNLLPIFS